MQIPISYALGYPNRIDSGIGPFDLSMIGNLNFSKVDHDKFPSIRFAYEALLDKSGNLCLIINAANELAVAAFLEGKINFVNIYSIIEECFNLNLNSQFTKIEDIIEADYFCRQEIKQIVKKYFTN